MKALVKYASGPGNMDVLDVPEPECADDHVKVEVAFCGVCGTDLHVMHDTFLNYPPVILGHELSGTVAHTGREVKRVPVGTRVTVLGASAVTCGACEYCVQGRFIFCPKRRGMGHGVNGGFTQFVVVRPDQLYVLPPEISLEEGALTEPFAAAVQAVTEVTQVKMGDIALVSGPGPIGLLCAKLLIAQGVRTIVAGASGDDQRLCAAARFGASAVVQTARQDLAECIRDQTRGVGVDVAFECAGHSDSARACLESLRPLGQYTQVAICGKVVPFALDHVIYKQLTVRGSMCYTAATWDQVMNIYSGRSVRIDDLISAKLPISEWRSAFKLCATRSSLKVLLYPEG